MPDELPAQELFAQCAAKQQAAWEQFRTQYAKLIIGTIVKEAAKYGVRDAHDLADLDQGFYLKLIDHDGHVLRSFCWRGDGSDFRFLKTVVLFYVRDKMVARPQMVPITDGDMAQVQPDTSRELDLERIRSFARDTFTKRDYRIFMLRFFSGLTAKQIAAFPSLGLRESGVEVVLRKMIDRLRTQFSGNRLTKSGTGPTKKDGES